MKKRVGFVLMLGLVILLMACGATEKDTDNGKTAEQPNNTIEREIIAELEQTVMETPKRDAVVEQEAGVLDDPALGTEEDWAIQKNEVPAVFEALEEVYGGYEGFQKEGVLFLENQVQGAKQPGIWIGIKEPDKRLDDMLKWLQVKVDTGEILAKPIHFYRSAYTETDLQLWQEEVSDALQTVYTGRGSYSVAADILTGAIDITHDFLKKEQQVELKQQFMDYTIHFEQQGRLIAEPGEPTTTYPKMEFTTTPSVEGAYVMQVDEGQMLVIDTMSEDFNATSGVEDHYGAVFYKYSNAARELKVGQRVKVEDTGMILYSYPGQGSAKYVEVLPEYKPDNANLSESAVIVKAIEMAKEKSDGMTIIRSILFDAAMESWKVVVKQGEGEYEFIIKDA